MHPDPAQASFPVRLGTFVRFSHTVFALPFALLSMLVAGGGRVAAPVLGWILACMVSARTAAMCFNRLMDWEIDKLNPRTSGRHQLVSRPQAWGVLIASAAAAVLSARMLNPLCFALSPVMLFTVCFYSLTKRFTAYSHLFLGIALGIAPLGAWMAVSGTLPPAAPLVLGLAVALWTFGFDLIYSTLDAEFDRKAGLFSFPSRHGIPAALALARALHGAAALGFAGFGLLANLGWGYGIAVAVTLIGLLKEHQLAKSNDPALINRAFFHINALVSLLLMTGTAVDLRIWKLFTGK